MSIQLPRPELACYEEAMRKAFPQTVEELQEILGARLVAYIGRVKETRAVREWAEGQRGPGSSATETRLRETRGDAGYRGERLEIVDPGIVPERPSSPTLPLNLAAALLLGLVLPVLYLTLEMSYREQRAGGR